MKKSPLYYKSGGRPGEGSPINQNLRGLARKLPFIEPLIIGTETYFDVKGDESKGSTWEKTKKHLKENIGGTLIGYTDYGTTGQPYQEPFVNAYRLLGGKADLSVGQFIPKEYGGTKETKNTLEDKMKKVAGNK